MTRYLLTLLIATQVACVSVRPADREFIEELERAGIASDEVKVKDRTTAAVLNVLPGFGSFYLAVGTHQNAQWGFGLFNLLFWPVSVVWAIPAGSIDAKAINEIATVDYYRDTAAGREAFAGRTNR